MDPKDPQNGTHQCIKTPIRPHELGLNVARHRLRSSRHGGTHRGVGDGLGSRLAELGAWRSAQERHTGDCMICKINRHIYTCVHMYNAYTYTCMYTYIVKNVYIYVHMYVCTHTHILLCVYIHICIYIYIYMCLCWGERSTQPQNIIAPKQASFLGKDTKHAQSLVPHWHIGSHHAA